MQKDTEGKLVVKGKGRIPSGVPERSNGSDRLDALRLRAILKRTEPQNIRCGSGLPSPRGLGENPLRDEPRWLCRRGALGRERLEPVGDNLNGASSAAVGGLPLAALESSLDVDEATLAEVAASEACELAPEDYVVELGVALAVRGDPDGRDGIAGAGLPKFGSSDKAPDEGDLIHRVSSGLTLAGGGLLRTVCRVAGHFRTSCCVDRCHREEQNDCRAEQVRPEGSLALGPCSG